MRRLAVIGSAFWLALLAGCVAGLGATWLAGWKLDVVATSSMAPEMPEGTLAVVSPTRASAIEVGDAVTFRDPEFRDRVILHRVVEVIGSAEGPLLRTQGDANATPDPVLVPARSIEGRLRFAVPHVGVAVLALRPPVAPLVLIALPTLLFVVSEVRRARALHPRLNTLLEA